MQQARRDFMGFVTAFIAMFSFGTLLGADSYKAVALRSSTTQYTPSIDLSDDAFDPDGWL